MQHANQGLNGINTLLGAWIFLSPFIFRTELAGAWNAYIVGGAIALLSGIAWYTGSRRTSGSGIPGTVAVLGLWMAISPFIFAYGIAMAWNAVITGLLVLAFGGYAAYETGRAPTPRRA